MKEKENIIFGIRSAIEAIESGNTIDKIFVQKNLQGTLYKELENLLKKHRIAPTLVPIDKLNKLTRKNHQGIVAYTSPVPFHDLETLILKNREEQKTPFIILLDQITDVRNFGALLRSAECIGATAVVIPQTGSVSASLDAVKTSCGAIYHIPICKVPHLKDAIYVLQSLEIQTIAATEKTENSIYNLNLKKETAIVMGSEEKGVSSGILKLVDHKAKLPMLGKISSLNVSVAGGIFMYEALRQRIL